MLGIVGLVWYAFWFLERLGVIGFFTKLDFCIFLDLMFWGFVLLTWVCELVWVGVI